MKRRLLFTVINDLTFDQRMRRICRSLAANGFEVTLIGRKLKNSLPLEKELYQQHRMNLWFTKGKAFYLEYNVRLFFLLLFRPFDLVCGIDLDTLLPCLFVSKLRKKKCVYDAHEIFPEVPEVVRRPAIQKTWRRIEQIAVPRLAGGYTVSESVAGYFMKNYRQKLDVIRNMPLASDQVLPDQKPNHPPVLLYQGAVNEGRGLEAMIDCLPHLDSQLIIAGDGDLSAALKDKVKATGLSRRVTFTGKLPAAALYRLALQADLGINLLENRGLNYYYSLANKFFDYAQAGLPQVTMKFPEYEKMNNEYEVAALVNSLDPQEIIHAVNRLLTEKDFYFRLRQNCLRAREAWTWEKEEHKLLAFYRRMQ